MPVFDEQKIVIVTGASVGVGAATAIKLAEEGFYVIAVSRDISKLENLKNKTTGGIEVHQLDVTDDKAVEEFSKLFKDRPIQALINNAGGSYGFYLVEHGEPEYWRKCYDLNVVAPANLVKWLMPSFEKNNGGHIVMVTSLAGYYPYASSASYSAAKRAEAVVTDTLRFELSSKNIKITEIIPGNIASREPRPMALEADDVAEAIRWAITMPDHVNINSINLAHVHNLHR
jgi:NADP-dependent 3-hydroxy acid dehydrogenase YdfG